MVSSSGVNIEYRRRRGTIGITVYVVIGLIIITV